MSRTTRLKLAYPLAMGAGLAGSVALMTVGSGGWGLLAAGILLLVPGRIQGAAYRDFFRGRRLFAEGRAAESIPYFERFLERIRRRPALKHLVWLQWAAYTTDIEAMTLNNLGGAHIHLGDTEAAKGFLNEALRVDPRYPMPYYNLYLIATARGDDAEAERMLAGAHRLGFTGGRVDQALQHAGTALARLEGRGADVAPHE
ncbi:MAG TPA: hypothetical protein VHG93_16765 [Longimicrobium sp.]|nr:hypothetical protein [Longimicrobium sp.]